MKPLHQNTFFLAVVIIVESAWTSMADEVLTVPLPGTESRVACSFNTQPLAFEENLGQVDPEVRFLARGHGYQLFLTGTEAVMLLSEAGHREGDFKFDNSGQLENLHHDAKGDRGLAEGTPAIAGPHALRMRLSEVTSVPSIREAEPLRGRVNYFIGNDPSHWRTNISTFAKVRYHDMYPGTDLVYYGNEGRLEYDFVLAPGANPDLIALQFEGADRVELDPRGDLIAWVAGRPVRWQKPVVYQEFGGERIAIAATYRVNKCSLVLHPEVSCEIGFELATYDRTQPLVIDPVLVYSTYLGGSGSDGPTAIATDSYGNAYVTGKTASADFPTRAGLKSTISGTWDVFVSKISPSGELLYSTFLGGGDNDGDYDGSRLAVDATGACYLAGDTVSTNFPLVNPLQASSGGKRDGFVAGLKPDGSALLFSTYLGGSDMDYITSVALDPAGNIYVGGQTFSGDFPVHNAIQAQIYGGLDCFVTKLEAAGKNITYSTYLGGSGNDFLEDIVADADGNAYIAGTTISWDFPMRNAYQPSIAPSIAGSSDMVYAKILPDGSDLVYSSYFGGSSHDGSPQLALGRDGSFYITGYSVSPGLATAGAYQTSPPAWFNILARFNAADGSLVAATYLDPGNPDSIVIDAEGNVIVGGSANENRPLVDPLQPQIAGDGDCFIAKFNPDLSSLLFATYLGGAGGDGISGIVLAPNGDLLVAGLTFSTNFPTLHAFQPNYRGSGDAWGSGDAFVARISFSEVLRVSRSGLSLAVSWPATSAGYQLESVSTPGTGVVWEKVNTAPVVVGNDQVVTVPIEANSRFFRLRKP